MTFEMQHSNLVAGIFRVPPSLLFFILFVLLAGVTWYAAAARRMKLYNAIKPLVILPLIVWFILRGRTDPPYLFFLIGLCLSVVGDFLLAFWTKTTFFIGMFIFAITHFFYAMGYNQWPTEWFSLGNLLLVPAMVILFATLTYRPAAIKDPHMKTYFQAGMVYGGVILAMLVMAGISFWREGWSPIPATMALLGAILFVISDAMIAIENYGFTKKNLRFWVISSYHLSQFLIASSVLYVANGGFYL